MEAAGRPADPPLPGAPRRIGGAMWLIAAAALVVAVLLAALVPPGLPGDEPAHVSNVAWYGHHLAFPVLGAAGVLYEAQMGPVYYWLAAVPFRIAESGGVPAAVIALRLVFLPLVLANVLLVYRLAVTVSGRRTVAAAAAVFAGLSPSLAAIFASVQNDSAVITLTELALCLCATCVVEERPDIRAGVIAGAVAGAAILTKANAIFLLGSVPLGMLIVFRRRSLGFSIAFVAVALVISGWWFVRNQWLYGDYTAQSALTRFHYNNNPPPIPLWQPGWLAAWTYGLGASYWFPTEYFRDVFKSGPLIKAASAGLSGLAVAGWVVWGWATLRRRATPSPAGVFIAVQYLCSIALYAYTCARITYFAPRTTFPSFAAFALFLAFGVDHLLHRSARGRWGAVAVLGALLIAADAYLLYEVRTLPHLPFELR